ncbi:MAG: DNA-directed RNA polymerase subunit beta' [Mycoplasma sp.]|nr:DNA-directed RNA polymerase subunit beta' [Mycoplasma sp.]
MKDKTFFLNHNNLKPNFDNNFKSMILSIAKPEDVKSWSYGEVTRPETINYKSFKPEKGGLFDEIIFGPVIDYKCPICNTRYKQANENQYCEKTDECRIYKPQILPRSTRRYRMGHIDLATPIVHIWFFTINHSIITKILSLKTDEPNKLSSRRQIENIIYFRSHIVLESGGLKSLTQYEIIEINKAAIIYRNTLLEIQSKYKKGSDEYEDIGAAIDELEQTASSKLGQDYGVDFYYCNDIIHQYSNAKINTGAEAINYLLENFDLKAAIRKVKTQITKISNVIKKKPSSYQTHMLARAKLYKSLDVLNKFATSNQTLDSMIIKILPIIPADLRPLIQIDGDRHSTSDVNDLYRRIIIRNNRLRKWRENQAPVLIIQNELRMLQESIDALIDNAKKKPTPVLTKDNRPLKSISDALSGKKGRFRQNLLGKRVDYSGRSVIVVGPNLKMHQVGLPRQMAAKLFEPWIIRSLLEHKLVSSIRGAKKMIEEQDNKIWPHVENTILDKIVLLNRAPTLHRLSIQAFEPILVRGKAIMLHPLVTTAFNADFDGDQMAVHVPISSIAQQEARELMLASKNILGPKDGQPIINPGQDIILGLYYLTQEIKNAKGEGYVFVNYEELLKAYDANYVDVHARVALPIDQINKIHLFNYFNEKNYIISTVGKFIFNKLFPSTFDFIFDENIYKNNEVQLGKYVVKYGTNIKEHIDSLPLNDGLNKKTISNIIKMVYERYEAIIAKEDLASILDTLNSKNINSLNDMLSKIKDYRNEELNYEHINLLNKIINEQFKKINQRILRNNEDVERIFELEEKVELLSNVWFSYTNLVAQILDKLKDLGFRYSTISGTTMSISDITTTPKKSQLIDQGQKYIIKLKDMFNDGLITDDEKYKLSTEKWIEIKQEIENSLEKEIEKNKNNSLFLMIKSGARSNISNLTQLAGMRGLMATATKLRRGLAKNQIILRNTTEVPIISSFLDGLTAYEFYSSTHGARKGLTDTALNTSSSGYLTRRLVDVAQNIVVKEYDCFSSIGLVAKDIIDQNTNSIIVPFIERIEGRFTNQDVYDKDNNLIVKSQTFIDKEIISKIIEAGISQINIRSVFGCLTRNGVCQKCYGKDLASNRLVSIGEPVGILAAQSIGEPGTQLTMRTFHTGGSYLGKQDITGGFGRLMQLVDATKDVWEDKAIISTIYGKVKTIENHPKDLTKQIIVIEPFIENEEEQIYIFTKGRKLRCELNQKVTPGQKLVEGPIILHELLEVAGTREVEKYILKEIQKLYHMQGISIADKYIEIIIRQFLSKILITDQGDSPFFVGSLVDLHEYREVNAKLLKSKKIPAFGEVIINGAKRVPLLSESFLAAASYQETPSVLVSAAIGAKVDKLEGIKENVIIGHKIPAGTGFDNIVNKSKFDLKPPIKFFEKNE